MSVLFSGFKKNDLDEQAVVTPPQAGGRDEYGELRERVHLGTARMKTHFIGNVMTALHYLCDTDTGKAQESILALFGYLRHSVEGVNRQELLPFNWELVHAQNYISLETLRFEDRLQVYYEINDKDFEIPPLTLQPLVENAVKLGLAPVTDRPTNIIISTHRLEDGSVQLQVKDDGAGFDTSILEEAEYQEKSLACIHKRLARDLGAELFVRSAPGQGTTVTVVIPPKRA